ncbi:GNAT family N-acetyltransferase [Saprospiraceae bacterium]|nr:GNAT family N-acetyltransferase [Saprospiraceae bacterium]
MTKKSLFINKNLELRLPEKEFAKTLFQIIEDQREYLGKWLPWVEKNKIEKDSLEFLKSSILFNNGGQKLTTFIFFNQELVGSIAFVKIDKRNKVAEIGYWLSKNQQGNGIVSLACQRLIKYGFEKMNLNRIEINIASENSKSLVIPNKLGFIHEGTTRESLYFNDKFYDEEKYSLLQKEWFKNN